MSAHGNALEGKAGRYDLESGGLSFACYVEPLLDRDGRIAGALSASIDVTEVKRYQELLEASEARLRLMTEQAPAALWTTDRELRLTSAAGGVLQELGLRASDFLGCTITETCCKIGIDDAPVHPHVCALAGQSLGFESRLRGRAFAARVEPLRDREGGIIGAVGVAFDVTERKRAEEEARLLNAELERRVRERTGELEEALREMNAFSYTVAHDLRAPLRAIASGAHIILEESERLGEEARAWGQRIFQAAIRMDTLVSGLLDYSRLSRQEIVIEPVNLEQTVHDVVGQMERECVETGAQVVVEQPLPRVRGHALTLTQALANLLSNAIKFVPKGAIPQVRIRAERGAGEPPKIHPRRGWVRIWVEDQGIGIASEHLERIFGVFERLHSHESYPGTGIGLAIVKRVAERMGGKVGVESELGRGSQFYIDLPEA